MSFVVAAPELLTSAATDLASLGSSITEAHAVASGPTSQVLAAGADEVSAAVASLFSGHAQAYQALSAQVSNFHSQFVQALSAAQASYVTAEAANASPLQSVGQELQTLIGAPAQLLNGASLSGLNLGSLPNLNLGSLPNLNLGSGLSNLGSLLNPGSLNLSSITGPLTGGLANLNPGSINLGGLTSLLGGINPAHQFSSINLANLKYIPYNLFADVANIPYYESLAIHEYAFALGPAGSHGGVAGWIPAGASTTNGGIYTDPVTGLQYYGLGGTGSWYMESMGNTWGWDNGNWPQVDAIFHLIAPFSFTEASAQNFETFAQAELIDGAAGGTEFEANNPLGYLGGWFHGATPISDLLTGHYTFPNTIADTIPNSTTGVINQDPIKGSYVNWAGEPGVAVTPGATFQAAMANFTSTPAQNPIHTVNWGGVATDVSSLYTDTSTDFDPFVTGSFIYWGAGTDYSIPTAIAGTIQNVTGVPNQFLIPNSGAEPSWGYTAGPSSLLTQHGGQYLADGLLGYLDPSIYGQALSSDINKLTHPSLLLANAPLVGYLGLD